MRRDIIWTVISQGLVAATVFLQYWIVRHHWGLELFSSYSLAFRARAACEWIVLMQLPLAMARLMSAGTERATTAEIGATGAMTGLLLVGFACIVLTLLPAPAAALLFGRADHADWIAPFCAMLVAYTLYLLASGLLRGVFAFGIANAINVLSIALVPCAGLLLAQNLSARAAVVVANLASAALTLVVMAFVLVRLRRTKPIFQVPSLVNFRAHLRALLAFGAPRLSTLGLSALFAMVLPWLVARRGDTSLLATLNAAMALIAGAAILSAPTSFVLLPNFSRSIGSGQLAQAGRQLGIVLSATLYAGAVASFLALGVLNDVLAVMLGSTTVESAPLIIAVVIVMPLFLLMDVLRAPLDAVSAIPYNALMYLSGFVVTTGVFWLSYSTIEAPAVRAAGSLVAGYLAAALTGLAIARWRFRSKLFTGHDVSLLVGWIGALVIWGLAVRFGSPAVVAARIVALVGLLVCVGYVVSVRPVWYRSLLSTSAA